MAQWPKRGGSEMEVEEESNPMFVIKNLDTGLQMRIDDFDKIANLATAEQQEQEQHQKKGGLKFKGSKAIKTWTAETTRKASAVAKKAVSGIKDVAQEIKHEIKHELNAANVLTKHKSSRSIEPSPSKASSLSGAQSSATDPGDELLPRLTLAELAHIPDSDAGQSAGSLTSNATSEQSATTSQVSKLQHQHQQPSSAAAAGSAEPAPSHLVTAAAVHPGSPLGPFVATIPPASLASSQQVASTSAAVAAATVAASTAAAAAVPSGPAVPTSARLVSHKRSNNTIREAVLAQVLEGSIGVVWAVAFSRDGSFLATAGQDGVLRIWQLTASRDKEPRTNWVYTTSTPVQSKRRSSSSDSQQDQVQQQQQDEKLQQPFDTSGMDHLQQQGTNTPTSQQSQQQPALQPLWQHAKDQDTDSQLPQQQDGAAKQLPVLEQQPEDSEAQQCTQRGEPPTVDFGPYLSRQPVRIYTGHTEDILDVSWSAGAFILTASVDKTVRLWHISQPECLREFWHTDFVTSVQFHPLDAQRFVSGSIDGKINVWSITENAVVTTAQLHQDMVTAVAFSLNGGRVLAGTMRGRCRFYELADRKLEYVAQVDVRNQRGAHASGKKVTGICAVPGQPQQFLITTNDSRLRLLEGYGQILKFKGHRNMSTQLRASMSADGSEVVCGSDDGWVYVWQTGAGVTAAAGPSGYQQQHRGGQLQQQMAMKNAAYQAFHAHDLNVPVTAVACAPAAAYDGRLSVIGGAAGAFGGNTSTTALGMVVEGQLASVAEGLPLGLPFAADGRGRVQQLVVSGAFNGAIRVHELM